jgi:subtilisin family serine protease
MDLRQVLGLDLSELARVELCPVEVCVVDSGVDGSHPDLRGRVIAAMGLVEGPAGPVAKPLDPAANNDELGHGTSVAGIIAAIAPNARLTDVRVLDAAKPAPPARLVEGLRRAVARRPRLINVSVAAPYECSAELHDLCEEAFKNNTLVVASPRNRPVVGSRFPHGFPAEFSSCIAVDRERLQSPFDLRWRPTPPVEYRARGADVLAPAAGGGYRVVTGTSFATPTVTGLCALLLGIAPDLRPYEVKAALKGLAS